MASTRTLRASLDAWVREDAVNQNYGVTRRLHVQSNASAIRRSFIFFPRPFPLGATILDAKLRLKLANAWAGGPHTITVTRITQSWKEGRLTWSNAPSITTSNQATLAVTGGVVNQVVEIDVDAMMQDISGGGNWFGFRLTVNTTGAKYFYAAEAVGEETEPQLFVQWAIKPEKPTDLVPGDGAFVQHNRPTLQWTFRDADGVSDQVQAQVQLDDADTFASPTYDSGWVAAPESQFDLEAAGAPTLTDGQQRWWRVRVQDGDGLQSDWSDIYDFTYDAPGTLTITNPSSGTPVVDETTPPITWTFTGETQRAYRVILQVNGTLTAFDGLGVWRTIYDSGVLAGTGLSHTLPSNLIKHTDTNAYRVIVRVWDTKTRVGTKGFPAYQEATRTFTFTSTGPTAVTGLTATPEEAVVRLNFSRTSMPDFFALKVDGKLVEDRIDSSDAFVSGTAYRYYYHGAKPRTNHLYEIVAVVVDAGKLKHSTGNSTVSATASPRGIWILQPDGDKRVCLVGETTRDLTIGEDTEVFNPIGRRDPVRITQSLRGYEGGVGGDLEDVFGFTAKQYRDAMEDIKSELGSHEVRLVVGDMNIPVLIGQVSISPERIGDRYDVSAEVFQVGEYSFPVSG